MNRGLTFRREAERRPSGVRVLRAREPRGLLDAGAATAQLNALCGYPLRAVDTSMARLVVAIDTRPMHLIVVSGPLTVASAGGVRSWPDPTSPEALAGLTRWVGRTVTAVRVDPAGGLRVECGADSLLVAADPQHEAWEIRGVDGGLLACLPGGRISAWVPASGAAPSAG